MFDYDNDMNASLEDYRGLLATVIGEIFPSSRCTVRIRKTKAMASPKVSISIEDGPTCQDFASAIPLLAPAGSNMRWAHCGKVLPAMDFWVRQKSSSTSEDQAQAVWDELRREMPHACFMSTSGSRNRLNPVFLATHKRRLSKVTRRLHPAHDSPTMQLIDKGCPLDIVQIATDQRRDALDRATPNAKVSAADQIVGATCGGRKRL